MQCSSGESLPCADPVAAAQSTVSECLPVNGHAKDESQHLLMAMVFLLLWLLMVFYGVHVLLQERRRYLQRHVSQQWCFQIYLQYRFGHWYAWNGMSSLILLFSLSCTLLVFGGLLHSLLSAASISDSLWASWIWISAPDGGNSAQPGGYVVGMLVSVGGMLIFALLVSLITSAFEQQLRNLREGSVPVVEGAHIVILGWTPVTPVIIDELCMAMESRGGGTIVVLAVQPKPDVENYICQLQNNGELQCRNSDVVVRSGSMCCKEDLRRVAVGTARRVLVLADTASGSREEADSRTLNILLTMSGMMHLRHSCAVVECCLMRNQPLFLSLASESSCMQILTIQDFIGSLMVESSCQRGLASIIQETLGFAGQEFYVKKVEGCKGWVFRDLLFVFPQAVPVGVVNVGHEAGVKLLPPMDYVLQEETWLVLLAEDASTCPSCIPPSCISPDASEENGCQDLQKYTPSRRQDLQKDTPSRLQSHQRLVKEENIVKELVVILGWNEAICSIMYELDQLIGPESKVIVYSPRSSAERQDFLSASQKRRRHTYRNLSIQHLEGSLGARYKLDELPLENASKIFILAESTATSTSEADGQTIAAVLQVRDILRERRSEVELENMVIIPQLLGKGAEDACYSVNVPDCIDSNRLSARALATVCEEPELAAVWGEFLSETGARFRIRKLSVYSNTDCCPDNITFHEVTALAASCGEIAIGWSRPDAVDHKGVCRDWEVNPAEKSVARLWDEQASVVTVSPPRPRASAAKTALLKMRSIGAFRRSGSSLASLLTDKSSLSLRRTNSDHNVRRFDSTPSVMTSTPAADDASPKSPQTPKIDGLEHRNPVESGPQRATPLHFVAHLSSLADMHSKGLLSEAEFTAAKAKLLQP